MSKNIGEYDELRIKLRLIEIRDSNNPLIIEGKTINLKKVGLEREFSSIPNGVDIRRLSDSQIEELANRVGAGKAKGSFKADVILNGDGYSVKSHRSAPPAIVNHTPRWGWYRICQQIGVDITLLDEMVEEYFNLRRQGVITEDIYNSDKRSPFAGQKEYLRPLLNYFLFKGTGAQDSKYPAKYVLDCKNPFNTDTWIIHGEDDYIDMYWNAMKFSMRNKGFEAYPYTRASDLWKTPLSEPWAKVFDGSIKGSLHIRVN